MDYNIKMEDFIPFFTRDGSVGLYSKTDEDIYHSVYGALSEAYDKFVLPANIDELFMRKNEIKILDICYGIGYNTKAFLNYFLKNILQKKIEKKFTHADNIYSIDTDNILTKERTNLINYNYAIDTNNILNFSCENNELNNEKKCEFNLEKIKNKFASTLGLSKDKFLPNYKINITAIDTNDILLKLSPLFRTVGRLSNAESTGIKKVDKYLKNKINYKRKYKLSAEVNFIILMSILDKYKEDYSSAEIEEIFKNVRFSKFLDKNMLNFMQFYRNQGYKLSKEENKSTFLHNIYYRYISTCYKNTLKVLKNNEISFEWSTDDARSYLRSVNSTFDVIFLDGFTPSKCPSLWSFEFLNILYSLLDSDGMLVTYSNSPAVRNALIQNGFYIGKIYNFNEQKFTGTIAAKNSKFIKYALSDYEMGLLKTKSGIVYHDKTLLSKNEEIINEREIQISKSDLISSTQYIKNNRGKKL